MNVVFVSNFLSDHQLPFCLKMYELTEQHFYFIATTPIEQQRVDLGFEDLHRKYLFIIRAYESDEENARAHRLAQQCDMLLFGSAPISFVAERACNNQFVFCYSERLYKKGKWQALSPRGLMHDCMYHMRWRKKPVYMLCASAYTAYDYSMHGCYVNKTYKWGYFPSIEKKNIPLLFELKNKSPVTSILWVGRLIDWKHPESTIVLCKNLRDLGKRFHIDVVGCGDMETQLVKLAFQNSIQQYITFHGAQPPAKVREFMDRANIFIATSDQNEGWGAVLNEAMNSACAVVASDETGAAPYLIHSGDNGLLFHSRDWYDLTKKVVSILDDVQTCRAMGQKGYETISTLWNADVAAERILQLYRHLIGAEDGFQEFADGPCSRA